MSEIPEHISFNDNQIIKTSADAETQHYKFRSPYEISIAECLVRNIIHRSGQHHLIHLVISGTEAHTTLSNFVTEVAKVVGLDKTINISNIVLELDFNHIKLICDPSNTEIIMDDPGILKNTYIDIVIDWLTFYISSGNMGVQLSLSQITAPNLCIHNASPKIIPPDQAPELYKSISSFNITFDIKDKDTDLDSDHAHEI